MNCDNLRHNGDHFRKNLRAFLGASGDAALLAWMDANTTCPNAMVDRITPRPHARGDGAHPRPGRLATTRRR